MNIKKLFKFLLVLGVLVLILHFLNVLSLGIDYRTTLQTKYFEKGERQIIETEHFEILTPKNWIHLFRGYGCELNACGSFLTSDGLISYDYGFSTQHVEVDSNEIFSIENIETDQVNYILTFNDQKEMGVVIYQQGDMEFSLSFYRSEACFKNKQALMEAIESMRFKDFLKLQTELEH